MTAYPDTAYEQTTAYEQRFPVTDMVGELIARTDVVAEAIDDLTDRLVPVRYGSEVVAVHDDQNPSPPASPLAMGIQRAADNLDRQIDRLRRLAADLQL